MNTLDWCAACESTHTEPDSHTCFTCSNRVLRQLRELDHLLPHLDLQPTRGDSERGSPGFASQSPGRDGAIHHTDWRSAWHPADGHGALATLHEWATVVRDDRQLAPPERPTATGEIALLRTNHQWLMNHPAVGDYTQELRHIHAAVRATAGDPIPKPVGRCIAVHPHGECTGSVYELDDASGARCATCRRVYSGMDLVRFHLSQPESTT